MQLIKTQFASIPHTLTTQLELSIKSISLDLTAIRKVFPFMLTCVLEDLSFLFSIMTGKFLKELLASALMFINTDYPPKEPQFYSSVVKNTEIINFL